MTSVRVHISTTSGLAEVCRIAEEPSGTQSVIGLHNAMKAVPVSRDYHGFVANPTGVVEKLTGHGAYFTDVSQTIDGGDSWKLGLYLAHWLKFNGWLAESGESADLMIVATGDLRRDLTVGAVDEVPAKARLVENIMNADTGEDATPPRVVFVYPATSGPGIHEQVGEIARDLGGIELIKAQTAVDVCRWLGERIQAKQLKMAAATPSAARTSASRGQEIPETTSRDEKARSPQARWVLVAGSLIALLGAAATGLSLHDRQAGRDGLAIAVEEAVAESAGPAPGNSLVDLSGIDTQETDRPEIDGPLAGSTAAVASSANVDLTVGELRLFVHGGSGCSRFEDRAEVGLPVAKRRPDYGIVELGSIVVLCSLSLQLGSARSDLAGLPFELTLIGGGEGGERTFTGMVAVNDLGAAAIDLVFKQPVKESTGLAVTIGAGAGSAQAFAIGFRRLRFQ